MHKKDTNKICIWNRFRLKKSEFIFIAFLSYCLFSRGSGLLQAIKHPDGTVNPCSLRASIVNNEREATLLLAEEAYFV